VKRERSSCVLVVDRKPLRIDEEVRELRCEAQMESVSLLLGRLRQLADPVNDLELCRRGTLAHQQDDVFSHATDGVEIRPV